MFFAQHYASGKIALNVHELEHLNFNTSYT
jgi:hypothetical protein